MATGPRNRTSIHNDTQHPRFDRPRIIDDVTVRDGLRQDIAGGKDNHARCAVGEHGPLLKRMND